jgi:hypothetical protein
MRLGFAAVLLLSAGAPAAGPGPQAPGTSLGRFVPAEGLIAFLEFDGIERHEAAWKGTAAHAVLNETTTGAMLASLFTQLADVAAAQNQQMPLGGKEWADLVSHVTRQGFALGVNRTDEAGPFPLITAVLRDAGKPPVKASFEKLLRALVPEGAVSQLLTRQDGRKLVLVRGAEGQPGWVFWFEGDDLIISVGAEDRGADLVVAALAQVDKSAAGNPWRAELSSKAGGFEPVLWAWLDPAKLPPTPPELGLAGLKRLDYRWGFEAKELVSVMRLQAPQPRTGLLSLLDQPTIGVSNFPPIPAQTTAYMVWSLQWTKAYDTLASLVEKLVPDGKEQIAKLNEQVTTATGLKLREDILEALGARWAFYVSPSTIPAPLTPIDALGAWVTRMPPLIALGEVNDTAKLTKLLDLLTKAANPALATNAGNDGKVLHLEALQPPETGLRLVVPGSVFPLPTSIDPGVLYNQKYVGLSNSVRGVRQALALAGANRLVPEKHLLPPGLVYLETHDPRDRMPELIANAPFFLQLLGRAGPGFPMQPPSGDNPIASVSVDRSLIPDPDSIRALVFPGSTVAAVDELGLTVTTRDAIPTLSITNSLPLAVGLFLPAIQSARAAAMRAQSTNNMKQIALAMHNYNAVNGDHFPAAAICDADGKPLLSWRVAILPYIEQQNLYQQFHLDEPWDSAHNKPLLEQMPKIYGSPADRGNPPANHTYYQVFQGNGAMFEINQGCRLADITDGTSNTIMAVEAGVAVPWTKPEDLEFDPEKALPKLGGMNWSPPGFNAAFGDGSVRFLLLTLNKDVLKALITRAGGEVINSEDLTQ